MLYHVVVTTWCMEHGVTDTTVYIVILIQSWSWWSLGSLILFKVAQMTITVSETLYMQLVSTLETMNPLHVYLSLHGCDAV